MSELVFSIANTFSVDPQEGVLGQSSATSFFIAPYQRGYKWSSETTDSPVQKLLSDLSDAFSANLQEYYLQYITLSESRFDNEKVLEVIDGQQRLTTLTLLFSVLSFRRNNQRPLTYQKLSYEVRPKVGQFFKEYIFKDITEIIESDWINFIEKEPEYDEQDIYYLFHATKKIDEFISELNADAFEEYVEQKVKLIINKVDKSLSAEKIFANLNTNKVELTSAELIKGLLLTKAAREMRPDQKTVRFKEVMELRSAMGRQWDEIDRWVNHPQVNSFYFRDQAEPIDGLLKMVALRDGFVDDPRITDKKYLFNYFQKQLKKPDKSAKRYFNELKKLKSVLLDWFADTQVYNLIGFLGFAKGSTFKLSEFIKTCEQPKTQILDSLHKQVQALIPKDLEELEYGENDNEIHRVLLALNVFSSDERFDFYAFQKSWSLEHIFPQNPEKFASTLGQADINFINSFLSEKLKQSQESGNDAQKELSKNLIEKFKLPECSLDDEEVDFLCELMKSTKTNSLGNMALLTKNDNSSNSNGMFEAKRMNIVRLISNGSFVPKHTYDVFSKLLSKDMETDLKVWTEKDIDAHQEWMIASINGILAKGKL